MRRLLFALLLSACAASTPAPAPAPVEQEPLCGFTRKWMHCCVMVQGPNLLVSCKELQEPPAEEPKISNPGRDV